jgi:hypothetical protein
MTAIRLQTTLTQDSTLTLQNLPFHAGDRVEVVIALPEAPSVQDNPYPLRGTPLNYEMPLEPIAIEDWETLS